MFKITGLDQLTKQLEQAQQAIDELDGKLATVSFDPNDPASIDAAIQQANASFDAKVTAWADNPLVAQVAEGMKEQLRESIIQRAAAARLEGNDQ
jgi:DNA-binding GntR family transcriptional regulator